MRWSFELCVDGADACRIAEEGGATRIELCERLDVGGVTPSPAVARACVAATSLPVHGMVRPRSGSFVMSADEFVAMEESVHRAKALGLAGVVFGLLLESGEVDVVRTRRLVELAKVDGLEVTFHRAIDETPLPLRALEDVIGCGVDRVLTSGGAVDVIAGMDELEEMTRVAAGRVVVAAGGGVRVANASLLAGRGLCDLHGTLGLGSVRVEDVRGVVEVLKGAR